MGKKHRRKRLQAEAAAREKTPPVSPDTAVPEKKKEKWWKVEGLPLAALLIVTVVAFYPSLDNGFNWDDIALIVQNESIKHLTWDNIKSMFTDGVMHRYIPLTSLSMAINYKFSQLDPWGYHLTNLLFHLVNIVLVYYLIRFLHDNRWVAMLTTILFALHPMHVEPVAWLTARPFLLGGLFWLAALLLYLKYTRGSKKGLYYGLSLLCYVAGLAASTLTVTLAPTLLLVDIYNKRSFKIKDQLDKIPYFGLALLFGMIMLGMAEKHHTEKVANSFFDGVLFASYGLVSYLYKLVVPIKITVFHPYPDRIGDMLPLYYYISFVVVLGVLALFVYAFKKNRYLFFGIGFFLINIFLTLKFTFLDAYGTYVMADRYTYHPYIGLSFILVLGLLWVKDHYAKTPKFLRSAILPVFFAFSGLLAFLSFDECKAWKDGETLWTDVINAYPDARVAYNNRAVYYYERNRNQESLADCNKALSLSPTYLDALTTRGLVLYRLGNYQQAMADQNRAIELNPNYHIAYNNRGETYRVMGEYDLALADYEKTLQLNPNYFYAYNNRGIVYLEFGQYDKALESFAMAIKVNSVFTEAYVNMSIAHFNEGRHQQAFDVLDQAIRIRPGHVDAHANKSVMKYKLGQHDEALFNINNALKINPNVGVNYYRRSLVYKATGKFHLALQDAMKARQLGASVSDDYINSLR